MSDTQPDALEILDSAIPAAEAVDHPILGKIWRSPSAAIAAAKRRRLNGMDSYGAVVLISDRLHFIPEAVARWALRRGQDGHKAA